MAKTALDYYKNISATTSQMLAAAQAQDWDLLVTLEKDCAQYRDTLIQIEAVRPVGKAFTKVKAAYIKKILDDDRQIRALVSPWMKKLEGMLNMSRPSSQHPSATVASEAISLKKNAQLVAKYQT